MEDDVLKACPGIQWWWWSLVKLPLPSNEPGLDEGTVGYSQYTFKRE